MKKLLVAVLLIAACATTNQKPLTTEAAVRRSKKVSRIEARTFLIAVSIGCLGYCDETRAYLQYVIDSSREPRPAARKATP
jgi:hypothetical protein